jgi:hypothetical protein
MPSSTLDAPKYAEFIIIATKVSILDRSVIPATVKTALPVLFIKKTAPLHVKNCALIFGSALPIIFKNQKYSKLFSLKPGGQNLKNSTKRKTP